MSRPPYPKPVRAPKAPPAPLERSQWGAKRRQNYYAEIEQSRMFEQWLQLHKWQWWHVNLPMRSRAGKPDYECYRERIVFVELKARNPITGRMGKLSAEQMAFIETIKKANGEVYVFRLPDDWDEIEKALK